MNGENNPSSRLHCASCGFILVDGPCGVCGSEGAGRSSAATSRSGSGAFSSRVLMSTGVAGLLTSLALSTLSSGQGAAVEATTSVPAMATSTTTQAPVATTASAPAPTTTLSPTPSPTLGVRPTPATTAKKPRTTSPPTLPPSTTTTTPTTTTTLAPGPHGKRRSYTTLWASSDKKHEIYAWVGKYTDGSDGIGVYASYPRVTDIDSQCATTTDQILEYVSYWSTDGGVTSKEKSRMQIPGNDGKNCQYNGWAMATLYTGSSWIDPNWNKLSTAPPPIHVRFTLKYLRSNTVIESPWVLVDANTLP